MRRPLWLASGVVIGVSGTIWAERKVRRVLDETSKRLSGEHAVHVAKARMLDARDRVREAIDAGRAERERREGELRGELGLDDSRSTINQGNYIPSSRSSPKAVEAAPPTARGSSYIATRTRRPGHASRPIESNVKI